MFGSSSPASVSQR